MDIGLKIKELRNQNGLTLEEVAARSELTKGFLSQLERNLTSPSISTLEDILAALGTDLSEFFEAEKDAQFIFREEDYYVNEKDGVTTKFIVPNAQRNDMEPIVLTLEKRERSFLISPHEGEEFGYILEGSIQIINGKKKGLMKQGETFYLRGKHEHYIENIGNTKAVILWIMTPPNF